MQKKPRRICNHQDYRNKPQDLVIPPCKSDRILQSTKKKQTKFCSHGSQNKEELQSLQKEQGKQCNSLQTNPKKVCYHSGQNKQGVTIPANKEIAGIDSQ
jgi:hypothetical protein